MGAHPVRLNLGAGLDRKEGWVSVDLYGEPDVRVDLSRDRFPWADGTVSEILAAHVFEHLEDWWHALCECARVLRPCGRLEIRTPHESSTTALGYRDHRNIITPLSFHGIEGMKHGTNAWAIGAEGTVPLVMREFCVVLHSQYLWMLRPGLGWLRSFCANHLRNFVKEQRLIFERTA